MTTRDKLTKKQRGFVKTYVETGNGTKAALTNYDIKSPDKERVAASIAAENLTKPDIQEAIASIADRIPDDLLVERHHNLLNSTSLQHMVFPPGNDDEDGIEDVGDADLEDAKDEADGIERVDLTDKEIITMLEEVNCKVKRIVHGERARHVYFWARDNNAISKALDLAYKIKGTYAPEQKEVRMVGLIAIQDATKKILES